MNKYKLTNESITNAHGVKLFRIQNIKTKKLGGFIESEKNLDQTGKAWVSGDAQVCTGVR